MRSDGPILKSFANLRDSRRLAAALRGEGGTDRIFGASAIIVTALVAAFAAATAQLGQSAGGSPAGIFVPGAVRAALFNDPDAAKPEFTWADEVMAQALLRDRTDAEAGGPEPRTARVERGDTLRSLFEDHGAAPDQAGAAANALMRIFDARALREGDELVLTFEKAANAAPALGAAAIRADADAPAPGDVLTAVYFRPKPEREIWVRRDPATREYTAEETVKELVARTYRAGGRIDSSLVGVANAAGIPLDVTYQMIRIFSYDVDWQRDLHVGDSFEIVFERYHDDEGTPVKSGNVLFASLTLRGQTKELYRFTPPDDGIADYFDSRGMNAKKFLMRTPVDGARISSGFGMRRHPVLGYSKMHKGIDFAAPTGTPIMAAGQGTIDMAGWNGGYGKYIRIRHQNNYATAYAHLSRFAPGITKGARVRQGQVIGYVGSTGRSTGPHLHYEILVNGKQVNPTSVKVPTGRQLDGKMLTAFQAERARIDAMKTSLTLQTAVAGLPPQVTPAQLD